MLNFTTVLDCLAACLAYRRGYINQNICLAHLPILYNKNKTSTQQATKSYAYMVFLQYVYSIITIVDTVWYGNFDIEIHFISPPRNMVARASRLDLREHSRVTGEGVCQLKIEYTKLSYV